MTELQRRDLFQTAGLIGAGSLLTAHATPAAARGIDVQTTTVFERFEGGYHTFRGPNPVRTKSGTLLAFASGKRWRTCVRVWTTPTAGGITSR